MLTSLVCVVVIGAAGILYAAGAFTDDRPEEVAIEWARALSYDDPSRAYALLPPAQKREIGEDKWRDCVFLLIDPRTEDSDANITNGGETEFEIVETDPNEVTSIWGDDSREYKATFFVVRATKGAGPMDYPIHVVEDPDEAGLFVPLEDERDAGGLSQYSSC